MPLSLIAAVRECNRVAVMMALEERIPVNERDANGRTALHYAVLSGDVDIVSVLLMAGVDLSIRDYEGRTAGDLLRDQLARLNACSSLLRICEANHPVAAGLSDRPSSRPCASFGSVPESAPELSVPVAQPAPERMPRSDVPPPLLDTELKSRFSLAPHPKRPAETPPSGVASVAATAQQTSTASSSAGATPAPQASHPSAPPVSQAPGANELQSIRKEFFSPGSCEASSMDWLRRNALPPQDVVILNRFINEMSQVLLNKDPLRFQNVLQRFRPHSELCAFALRFPSRTPDKESCNAIARRRGIWDVFRTAVSQWVYQGRCESAKAPRPAPEKPHAAPAAASVHPAGQRQDAGKVGAPVEFSSQFRELCELFPVVSRQPKKLLKFFQQPLMLPSRLMKCVYQFMSDPAMVRFVHDVSLTLQEKDPRRVFAAIRPYRPLGYDTVACLLHMPPSPPGGSCYDLAVKVGMEPILMSALGTWPQDTVISDAGSSSAASTQPQDAAPKATEKTSEWAPSSAPQTTDGAGPEPSGCADRPATATDAQRRSTPAAEDRLVSQSGPCTVSVTIRPGTTATGCVLPAPEELDEGADRAAAEPAAQVVPVAEPDVPASSPRDEGADAASGEDGPASSSKVERAVDLCSMWSETPSELDTVSSEGAGALRLAPGSMDDSEAVELIFSCVCDEMKQTIPAVFELCPPDQRTTVLLQCLSLTTDREIMSQVAAALKCDTLETCFAALDAVVRNRNDELIDDFLRRAESINGNADGSPEQLSCLASIAHSGDTDLLRRVLPLVRDKSSSVFDRCLRPFLFDVDTRVVSALVQSGLIHDTSLMTLARAIYHGDKDTVRRLTFYESQASVDGE